MMLSELFRVFAIMLEIIFVVLIVPIARLLIQDLTQVEIGESKILSHHLRHISVYAA
jgi:hypothetical protein